MARTILLSALLATIIGAVLALRTAAEPLRPSLGAARSAEPKIAPANCPDDLIGRLMKFKLEQRSLSGDYDPDRDAPDHLAPAWMEFDPDQSDEDCQDY